MSPSSALRTCSYVALRYTKAHDSLFVTQTAKFNFGVLLGWSVVCSMTIWFVVSSMAGPEAANKGAVDLYSCMCLLGYGMLPMVLYALVSLLIPRCAAMWIVYSSPV